MGKHILVVDDDPAILQMVESVLKNKGHRVTLAVNGDEGLKKALESPPDLIITDVLMPIMDGWAFIRKIRSHKELALIPVIFLTALDKTEDRILGFRLGADDYLPKPFHLEELQLRIQRVLDLNTRMQSELKEMTEVKESVAGLQGDLSHLGLSSLLTVLEMERKSGILVIKDHETARIFLNQGRIVDAMIEGKNEPRGAEAVYHLLTWTQGKFEFSDIEVEMEDSIKISTTYLLMEGARRIDEKPK